jgi:hypothetical protein
MVQFHGMVSSAGRREPKSSPPLLFSLTIIRFITPQDGSERLFFSIALVTGCFPSGLSGIPGLSVVSPDLRMCWLRDGYVLADTQPERIPVAILPIHFVLHRKWSAFSFFD